MTDYELPDHVVTRREALRLGAAGAAALATGLGCGGGGGRGPVRSTSTRVAEENALTGTRDWLLTKTAVDVKTVYRCPWIEGYASKTSVEAGETIDFMVSTNPASAFTIDLYRMGWYGGLGARHMATLGPFTGATQPDPPIGPQRVRECEWAPATTITIPTDWLSGVYLGKLTAEKDGWQSYIVFIVRDRRQADFLFQCSTNTWQAYNRWPSQFALYDDGVKKWYWGPDVRVSYDRPYGRHRHIYDAPLSTGSGEFLLWEFPVAFWMEAAGYDVTYSTDVDTHASAASLLRARAFLSVGHDEYWSHEMYQNVQAAIQSGVHAAFLCGNSVYGIAPMAPSSRGVPDRTFSRTGVFGPIDARDLVQFPEMKRFTENGPLESPLMGTRSVYPTSGGGDWVCVNEGHWLFEGTGMRNGEGIPALVGWEYHGAPAPLRGLEIVAKGPTNNSGKQVGQHVAVVFPGPRNNVVFNAGTIWWGDGLAAPPGYIHPAVYKPLQGPDKRVQRITGNLFTRFLST